MGPKKFCATRATCKTPSKTGYEIGFTRYFYKPQPLRRLEEIRADILTLERETAGLLGEISSSSGDGR